MNVLYLTMNPNRQSTNTPTEEWIRYLSSRGLSPVLVSRECGQFQAWAKDIGISTYQDPLKPLNKRAPWQFIRSLWRLGKVVRRHGVEVIHCNEQNVYPFGSWLARLCALPVVVSVHFTMPRDFCQWAFGGPRQPDRMFFVSEGNREACQQGVAGVVDDARQRVLLNGIDLEEHRPEPDVRDSTRAAWGLGDELVLGVACALRPRKQLEHLFDAAARLLDTSVRVVVAGAAVRGDEAYAEGLIAYGRSRLGDRLLCLGHVDDLCGFYNGIDVFVNTSQEEACSISVIESLAYGVPVVGYPSKSVDGQILPHGGEIVQQDDVKQLATALGRWGNDDKLDAGRRGARSTAEERFDIARISEQLWSEYETVLSDQRSNQQ